MIEVSLSDGVSEDVSQPLDGFHIMKLAGKKDISGIMSVSNASELVSKVLAIRQLILKRYLKVNLLIGL